MAIFSDYVRRDVPFLGGTVALNLRALDKKESPGFKAQFEEVHAKWRDSDRKEGETLEAYGARLEALLAQVDAFLLDIFTREKETKKGPKGYFVRLIEALENEDDDERSIRTCAQLFERGDMAFRFRVLNEIAALADVEASLGNSSGSPSTSSVATSPNTSDEAAPITDRSDSTSPSTATEAKEPAESSLSLA